MNYNKKITQNMKNPTTMYMKLSDMELENFFSKGFPRLYKARCFNSYNLSDFRRGILEANRRLRSEENIHTVDLMMFALAKIEDLQILTKDMEEIIKELEVKIEEENQEITETEDTKTEIEEEQNREL